MREEADCVRLWAITSRVGSWEKGVPWETPVVVRDHPRGPWHASACLVQGPSFRELVVAVVAVGGGGGDDEAVY